jgi:hypothetical protein
MNIATPLRAVPALCALSLCVCATARGEEAEGVHFQHGDWEVVCDNTLTCRIAGYSSGEDDRYGSVLVTRAAGPNAPLVGMARPENHGPYNKPPPQPALTLWIDGVSKGKLAYRKKESAYPLTQAQTRALLAAAKKDREIRFEGEGDSTSFAISGDGITAVLLKMDETQGRIGTPGALARKGNKPEKSVYPPRPAPVIRAAKVSKAPSRKLTASEVAALKPLLSQDCNATYIGENIVLKPLDERYALLSALCWVYRGAEESWGHWVIDNALKETPKFVMAQLNDYEKGFIFGVARRGRGDCHGSESWVWDGREFRQSFASSPGACRYHDRISFWGFPTFVTKVVNEDGTPRVPD